MKKYFTLFLTLLLSVGLVMVSCKKETVKKTDNGYAPQLSDMSGKTFSGLSNHVYFTYSGSTWNVTPRSTTLYPNFQLVSKSVSYEKNSENGATFRYNVSFTYRSSFSGNTQSYSTSGSLSLYFITPSEGYATGTKDGRSVNDESFTLL